MTKRVFKDILITVGVLILTFSFSYLLQNVFEIGGEHITTIFVFSVFIVSLITDGYIYGIISTFVGVVLVNYAFTYPFFAFDFMMPVNIVSAIVMITISLLTSAFTTKLKQWQTLKTEGDKERMRANLLRAVSHDIRTPLTTIYGASSAILDNNDTLTEKQKIQMVNGIKTDSEWLIRMVENLLSITRIDSGNVKLIKAPTVLDELVDAVILKFRKRYPEQKVELDLPDNLVLIPMDAILIEQVIINILENAVQHAGDFTRLSLKVFVLGGKAIFEISDNGCGIDKERLESIFTGYIGKEENADAKTRNAGIGLSVCQTIIKAHGGTISAENAKSGGAVFRFDLAIEEEQQVND